MTLRIFLAALFAVAASVPAVEVPKAPETDVVFRRGANPLAGRVAGLQGGFLRVEVVLREDQPPATLSVPVRELYRIVFAEREAERQHLRNPSGETLADLYRIWKEKEPFLAVDNSDAGDFGLAVGQVLLRSEREADRVQAMELFERIYARDWNPTRTGLAKQGQLRAMLRLGRAEEAIAEARELADRSEDPEVLIEANYVLAEAGVRELKSLLENHPRWEEDPWVRPERDRLYHETLDLLLFPYLFYGTEIDQSARGLSGALELHVLSGETGNARELAEDLVTLYPNTTEAAAAAAFLEANPTPSHEENNES